MKVLVEVVVFDIVLASAHLASDLFLVYSYFSAGDPWWGAITIAAIALPGLLGESQPATKIKHCRYGHINN